MNRRDLIQWLEITQAHLGGSLGTAESGQRRIDELLAQLNAEKPAFECHDCGADAHVHVFLRESDWNAIKPDRWGRSTSGGVLCLYCMSSRFERLGYGEGSVSATISNGPMGRKWGASS